MTLTEPTLQSRHFSCAADIDAIGRGLLERSLPAAR